MGLHSYQGEQNEKVTAHALLKGSATQTLAVFCCCKKLRKLIFFNVIPRILSAEVHVCSMLNEILFITIFIHLFAKVSLPLLNEHGCASLLTCLKCRHFFILEYLKTLLAQRWIEISGNEIQPLVQPSILIFFGRNFEAFVYRGWLKLDGFIFLIFNWVCVFFFALYLYFLYGLINKTKQNKITREAHRPQTSGQVQVLERVECYETWPGRALMKSSSIFHRLTRCHKKCYRLSKHLLHKSQSNSRTSVHKNRRP